MHSSSELADWWDVPILLAEANAFVPLVRGTTVSDLDRKHEEFKRQGGGTQVIHLASLRLLPCRRWSLM
jgi:hypothetical protein